MDIRQIQYASIVSKLGNFSKAADRLYITQPTLSQQIKKLEEDLGFQLFTRSTRSFSLTPEGEQFLQLAAPLLSAYDKLMAELENIRGARGTTIRLGLFPTFSHLSILEKIHRFQSGYPDMKINIQIERSAGLLDLLVNNEIDVAIMNIAGEQIAAVQSFVDVSVFSQDCVHAIVNIDHPLASQGTIRLTELKAEPIITLDKKASVRLQVENACREAGVRALKVRMCPDIQSMIGLIRSNEGIGFLSSKIALQHLDHRIRSIPIAPEIKTQTAVLFLHNSGKRELLEEFKRQIIEEDFAPDDA